MRAVAIAARAAGALTDGCDRRVAGADDELEPHGIAVAHGHDAAHVAGRVLVATTLAPPNHPEIRAAESDGLAYHRSDLLAALLRDRTSVAVTGTHGKGTVAALTGLGLVALRADPLVLLGVTAPDLGGSVRLGDGPAVVEADESDGSIARVPADVSVVTNVSFDHPQYRRTVRETLAALAVHLAAVPAQGTVILGGGRAVRSLEACARAQVWKLGRHFAATELRATAEWTSFAFADPEGGTVVGNLRLHSIALAENAALAYAALRALGYAPEAAAGALGGLTGLSRRFERVGIAAGVSVYDDYGKHPACIAATLAALRRLRPHRLHAVYEPHRYDHVRRWGAQLVTALREADDVVLLPIDDRDFEPRRPRSDWFRPWGLEPALAADHGEAVEHVRRNNRSGDIVCVFGVHDELASLARAILSRL